MTLTFEFVDLQTQRQRLGRRLDDAVRRVMDHGRFILGPEVDDLEAQLAGFTEARHVVTCANGTDALVLTLMVEEIGPGDAVLMPSFTFVATAEAVAQRGATPYLCDICEDDFALDAAKLDVAVEDARRRGLRPRAIMAVDLFGLPADYESLRTVADRHGLTLIADAAQSFGGRHHNRMVGTLADYTTTSFFPAKPLGCYGDGGAVLTDNSERADTLRSLRFHGKGRHKYDNVRVGLNSRLDTLQAAILLEKLTIFSDELARRERVAALYSKLLGSLQPQITVPGIPPGRRSAWAQYTLRSRQRAEIIDRCQATGIPVHVYYPLAIHQQIAYRDCPRPSEGLPVSERVAEEVFSIPMHPYLTEQQQRQVTAAIREAVGDAPIGRTAG